MQGSHFSGLTKFHDFSRFFSKFPGTFSLFLKYNFQVLNTNVPLHLRVQNAVPAQPCVGKLGISLVLLNFLHCNFRLWFKTP